MRNRRARSAADYGIKFGNPAHNKSNPVLDVCRDVLPDSAVDNSNFTEQDYINMEAYRQFEMFILLSFSMVEKELIKEMSEKDRHLVYRISQENRHEFEDLPRDECFQHLLALMKTMEGK